MRAADLMTVDVSCVTPDTSLEETARRMVAEDCGAIPVIDNQDGRRVIGIITDRDIVIRTLADGKNPMTLKVQDVMSRDVATVTPQTGIEDMTQLMEDRQVRRVPVVDEQGRIVGIVAQADIARFQDSEERTAEVVREISQPPGDKR